LRNEEDLVGKRSVLIKKALMMSAINTKKVLRKRAEKEERL
jgi:hypothetical protein